MNPEVEIAIVKAVQVIFIALIAGIPPAIVAIYTARKAATKVEEVKEDLKTRTDVQDEKLNEIAVVAKDAAEVGKVAAEVGKENHQLLNGNMSTQMRLVATFARELAISRGLPADFKAAELAEKALEEHEAKQPKASSEIPGDSTMKHSS